MPPSNWFPWQPALSDRRKQTAAHNATSGFLSAGTERGERTQRAAVVVVVVIVVVVVVALRVARLCDRPRLCSRVIRHVRRFEGFGR